VTLGHEALLAMLAALDYPPATLRQSDISA
jgi:hypothetical protein